MRNALLLLTVGMCGYLALLHVWFGFASAGPARWAGGWAISAAVFAITRHVGLQEADPEVALLFARLGTGVSLLVMWSLCGFVEALSGARARVQRFAPVVIGSAALCAVTPWAVRGLELPVGGVGEPLVIPGPLLIGVGAAIAATLGWCGRELWRAIELPPADRALLGVLLGAYGLMAVLELAHAGSLTPQRGLVEFAPLLAALGIGQLLTRHHARLEERLAAQIEQRTRDMAESEARYRGVVENVPMGLLAVDASGRLDHANAALLSMLGSTYSEFAGAFDVLSEENARSSGFSPMLARALATGESLSAEFEFNSWWGRRLITRTSVAPRRDTRGAITGALAIVEDITEQRAIERRLQSAQRVEAVGQLAAGIAHEINNPMAYVRANLSMLAEEIGALEKDVAATGTQAPALAQLRELRALLERSLASVGHTVSVVRDLRAFSHANAAVRESVDANVLLANAARLAATRSESAPAIHLELGEVPALVGVPGQLAQVFLTLLIQALHAAQDARDVSASTLVAGAELLVRVHDRGAEIPVKLRKRLFEPFANVRGEPGLALYVARQIVQEHGGRIEVLSSAGHGTTFVVRLPLPERRDE